MFEPLRALGLLTAAIILSPLAMSDHHQAQPADASSETLRHAVFFEWNDDASESDINEVVAAFNALPDKIDAIKSYASGPNVNDGGSAADLDHAFLVTFASDEKRATYLPHPDHKAFGDVLRPHLKSVFVIDYWGTPNQSDGDFKHAVFFKFNDDADPEAIDDVVSTFLGLGSKIDGVTHIDGGKNNSPERHDKGFTHGFVVSMTGPEVLKSYGPHPAHQTLVKKLKPIMKEVRVIDFPVEIEKGND